MATDRIGSRTLIISHQQLAKMIGARREAVTGAAAPLRKQNVIEYHRGEIQINDRPALEAVACDCYQVIRDEEANSPANV